MSANTKFANQSILGKQSLQPLRNQSVVRQPNSFQYERPKSSKTRVPPKVVETNDLSNPVTSNLVPTTKESKVVKNDIVIAPRIFRINPFKTSREDKFMPINQARASIRTKLITVSQPHVITKHGAHNLFLVGQFYDLDLEVTFRRNTYFIRNLEGVDLLKRNHTIDLYTINLHEMASASPIFLMARATSTKSWLRHQRLSHLNFDTINDLAKNDLVTC
ncbi:hypothetical protein Tco_1157334 [Tanacetum coccineum]